MEHISSSRTGPSFPAPPKPNLNFVFHNKLPKSGKVFIHSKITTFTHFWWKNGHTRDSRRECLGQYYGYINYVGLAWSRIQSCFFSTFEIIPLYHFLSKFCDNPVHISVIKILGVLHISCVIIATCLFMFISELD